MKPKRKRKPSVVAKSKQWQLQEAKAKFSEVFELALHKGPQRVSRRQKDAVVIVRESDFDHLTKPDQRPTVMEALREASKMGEGFTIPRHSEFPTSPEAFR